MAVMLILGAFAGSSVADPGAEGTWDGTYLSNTDSGTYENHITVSGDWQGESDDEGDWELTLTSASLRDYFTEEFSSGDCDLSNTAIMFTPDGGCSYSACRRAITQLPTDSAGSTPLLLGDDAYASVALAGGKTVSIYGSSFEGLFQAEMYFDGRIRLAWLVLAATDGIAGLSEGLGLPPGLNESNLSAYAVCDVTLVPVPDVVGLSQSSAESAITSAGLVRIGQ